MAVCVKSVTYGRLLRGRVQRVAAGPQVCDHVDGLSVGGDGGVNEGCGKGSILVAVITKVIREGVAPVLSPVGGAGYDGVQAAGVAAVVPAGVAGSDQSAVLQRHEAGDTEILASACPGGERLADGSTVRRADTHLRRGGCCGHTSHRQNRSKQKGKNFFGFFHSFSLLAINIYSIFYHSGLEIAIRIPEICQEQSSLWPGCGRLRKPILHFLKICLQNINISVKISSVVSLYVDR